MRRWILILLGIVIVVGVVGGAGYLGFYSTQSNQNLAPQAPPTVAVTRGDVQQSVTAPGTLVGAREQVLSMAVGGRLAQFNVRAGDSVKAGAILAQLDTTNLEFTLQIAQANLTSAQAQLNKLQAPPSDTDVAAARAKVTSAQSAYEAAVAKNNHLNDQIIVARANLDKATVTLQAKQAAYDRVAWRSDVGMMPQSTELQQATIDYQSALANYNLVTADINDSAVKSAAQALAQARADLATLTAPPSPQDIAQQQAAIDSAQIAVRQAQANLDAAKLVAPFDGVVQEVQVSAGDTVNAGAPLVQLSDPNALEARTTVSEEDYPLTKVGQTAQLYFDAQPDLIITGKISEIVPLRDSASSSPVYPVFITLDTVPPGLAPGMTVDGSILIAKRTNVLHLPRALVHARSDGSAQVRVWENGQTQTRDIQTGLRGDQDVEIISGLQEGEQVVSR